MQKGKMNSKNGLSALETTAMSLQIEACHLDASLTLLEANSTVHEIHHGLFV